MRTTVARARMVARVAGFIFWIGALLGVVVAAGAELGVSLWLSLSLPLHSQHWWFYSFSSRHIQPPPRIPGQQHLPRSCRPISSSFRPSRRRSATLSRNRIRAKVLGTARANPSGWDVATRVPGYVYRRIYIVDWVLVKLPSFQPRSSSGVNMEL